MNAKKGFSRLDIIVALACIALVAGQASVINAGGRERSKREICMANLRMLTAAWQMYASDNAGKIVNGAPQYGEQCTDCPAGSVYRTKATVPPATDADHAKELPWIGHAPGSPWGPVRDECAQKCAITTGALWRYMQNLDIYRCPVANKNTLVTYAIVDGMNGISRTNTKEAGVWMKNTSQIIKPASRFVFIDEGYTSPDSYAVNYNIEQWWDPPPVQHESGVTVSFADGHSAHHKWKSKETIGFGSGGYRLSPTTCDGKNDLYWMQTGCWGKLGYTPTCPVNIE